MAKAAVEVTPHNLEAERSVLGAILIHNEALDDIAQRVAPADFFRLGHRRIFEAMLRLGEQRAAIDTVTLKDALTKASALEDAGGVAYIAGLIDGVPRSTNVEYYARIVRDKATLRSLLAAAHQIDAAIALGETTATIAAEAVKTISAIAASSTEATGRRGRSAREICATQPPTAHWALPGYLAYGAVTEIDGPIKKGKTTFILYGVRAKVRDPHEFLGHAVSPDSVVYVSEQTDASLAEALKRAGLADNDRLLMLSRHDLRGLSWPQVVALARSEALRVGALTIVFDTLSGLARLAGDAENDAGVATETMAPVQDLASEGFAVLVARHDRKGGGAVGESARGSSAFGGAVDIIIALRQPEGQQASNRRVLEAVGRFAQTPAKLVVEMHSAHIGMGVWAESFSVLGDSEDLRLQEAIVAVRAHLTQHPGQSVEEIEAAVSLPRATVQRAIRQLTDDLDVEGLGRKGNPKRYTLKIDSAQTPMSGFGFERNVDPAEGAEP